MFTSSKRMPNLIGFLSFSGRYGNKRSKIGTISLGSKSLGFLGPERYRYFKITFLIK